MRVRQGLMVALLAACTACGGQQRKADAPPAQGPDGNVRLGTSVQPIRYALELTVDPQQSKFSGTAHVTVHLDTPLGRIDMHGKALTIHSVIAETPDGRVKATPVPGPNGGLAIAFDTVLPKGEATLHFEYDAPLPEAPDGLYRVKDGDDWYAYTQFEALHARQAFPCFDQPEFKTPYSVTIRVPKGMVALANGPETEHEDVGPHTRFQFAETKPIPTYLVAFAVGTFDIIAAPEGASPVPLRVITTKGKGKLARYALSRAPIILQALADYFGSPHPFAKLDLVAVPNFAAGAMENVGLVTFRETLLLLDPRHAPAHRKMWSQSVMAHELAHMWFGNLVTPQWWDDLWLNESFATWMATRIVQQVDPDLEMDLESISSTHWIMKLDAQEHTRAVRQPIKSGGDINNAFDGITYGKGARVLRMLESWIGPAAFREGVRRYMTAHAYGTATTAELIEAFASASGAQVEQMLAPFLDQPGTPLITTKIECAGDDQPAKLTLHQTRYRPAGGHAPSVGLWRIPVCVRYRIGKQTPRECLMLETESTTVPLSEVGCPEWLHPNAHQRGYYQWILPAEALKNLVTLHRKSLSMAERVALPGVLSALLEAGSIDVGTYLDALLALSQEEHRLVVGEVTSGLSRLYHVAVDDSLRAKYATLIQRVLGPHARRLGDTPRRGEPVEVKLLRPRIITALAYMGNDTMLRGKGVERTDAFLLQPDSVPAEILGDALPMAAWTGDAARWTAMVDALKKTRDPVTRVAIIKALGAFEDPELLTRSLGLLLDGTLRAQDFRTVMRGVSHPAARHAAWIFMTTHYDTLIEHLGQQSAPRLVWLGSGFCTAERRAEVEAFFSVPAHAPDGTARNLGLVLESIDQCIRLRAATQVGLKAWLSNQKS